MLAVPQISAEAANEPRGTVSNSVASPMSGVSSVQGLRLRPTQVTWEMTRAFSWKAPGARPARKLLRNINRFSTAEAFHLVDEIAAMHVPVLALTGGDPLTRPDLFPIIEFAARRSVRTSLTLLPTPLLGPEIISELKACGLLRVGLWLNGSTPVLNDHHWGNSGLYRRTLDAIGTCHEVQLPVQVNTILSRRNVVDLESMIELLTRLDVVLWNIFFFVPAKRDDTGALLNDRDHEEIFAKLYAASKRVHYQIKPLEAPHYRRFVFQQRARESRGRLSEAAALSAAAKAPNDSLAAAFISHTGEVYPSRYLPLSGGDVTRQSLAEVYRESPLFVSLRDSSRLKGKCGRCPARIFCGGSRARAYVMTGDLFASDPCCAFEP